MTFVTTPPPSPKLEVIPFTSFDYPHSYFVFLFIRHTGGCLSGRSYFSCLPGMAEDMKKKISGKTRGLAANNGARTAALKA